MMRQCALALTMAIGIGLGFSTPALAEASYDGLGQALAMFAVSGLAYLAFLIWLIVLALKRQKRMFLIVLAAGALVSLVVPAIDSGLLAWQRGQVTKAEISRDPPDLRKKTLLYISPREACNLGICPALMQLTGEAPMWALTANSLDALDLSQPVDLSAVPLQQYVAMADGIRSYQLQTPDTQTERPVFDYVVIAREPFYLSRGGALEAAIRQMPTGTFLGGYLNLNALAAQVQENQLNFATLQPDYLSLYISRSAYLPPLFPENTTYGSRRSYDWKAERANWFCGGEDLGKTQINCRNSLD